MAKNTQRTADQFKGERIIPIKNVPKLDLFVANPSLESVRRWCLKGIHVGKECVKLRHQRVGTRISTSVEAVEEFLDRTNQ